MIELTLLFLIKNNQILLAMKRRGFGAGRFNGAGGKVEPDESIDQALVRETQEEIGVTPINFTKMADITFDQQYKGQPSIMHVHVFTSDNWQGTPTESEEMSPQWFAINDIPYDNMWPDDTFWLSLVISGQKVSAKFKLDDNDVIVTQDVKVVDGF